MSRSCCPAWRIGDIHASGGVLAAVASFSDQPQVRELDELARRWQSLAERRRQHLLKLYRTGRWRLYYNDATLMQQMRDAVRNIKDWGEFAGPDEDDTSDEAK